MELNAWLDGTPSTLLGDRGLGVINMGEPLPSNEIKVEVSIPSPFSLGVLGGL